MIYSYKHKMDSLKRRVELDRGRESSFLTERTYKLLQELRKKVLVVPISTRTIEQYNRIDLGVGIFPYALVCNGGVLLVNGERDREWEQQSLQRIESSFGELERAIHLLEGDVRRKFELRFVEHMFVFTKCVEAERVVALLKEELNMLQVDVVQNREKVYVVPKRLSKGEALLRFQEDRRDFFAVAAGDSEFDISMLRVAKERMVPFGFGKRFKVEFKVREAGKADIFSEYALSECLKLLSLEK